MFSKNKLMSESGGLDNGLARHETDAQVAMEWEEVVLSEDVEYTEEMIEFTEPELEEEESLLDLDGGILDPNLFPALRMAFESKGMSQKPEQMDDQELEEYIGESDGEDGLSSLILRYAELDEQDRVEEQAEHIDKDLPLLFRTVEKEDEEFSIDPPPEETEEFSMQSELQKQSVISGELFEYIDIIKNDAENLIRRREQERDIKGAKRQYDPYNMSFNSRLDDSDEVLEVTPEIPIPLKYDIFDRNDK